MAIKIPTGNIFQLTAEVARSKTWRTWLIGRPLATADAPHQTIGKLVGLAVFASDALSSTAYATQEILMVLALAGAGAFGYSVPIAIAITVLMVIVTFSYEQTIHAYPGGGGAYIVARDNLGELPAQIAGAALLSNDGSLFGQATQGLILSVFPSCAFCGQKGSAIRTRPRLTMSQIPSLMSCSAVKGSLMRFDAMTGTDTARLMFRAR